MSNLIITIISIALTAIVALLGVYYGGTAFSNYQIKSTALRMISDAEQIAGAWQAYNANAGRAKGLPSALNSGNEFQRWSITNIWLAYLSRLFSLVIAYI